jgi:hypothetical protein
LVDETAGAPVKRVFSGRRINIAVIGVDSRIGSNCKHADANHILSILVDQGRIEMISIPRDTPADAGFEDTTGQNKLTIVYANRGRNTYLKEAARIAGLDRIHYYIEVGFSQAMGILEWLGHGNSGSSLQVLRSRTGLGGDDYQRTYNQAQFIRQTILKHFGKFTGTLGNLLTGAGLAFVETNLTAEASNNIIEQLNSAGFPRSGADIDIRIRPAVNIRYKVYDLTNTDTFSSLAGKIERYNIKNYSTDDSNAKVAPTVNVARRLENALSKAEKDSSKYPARVISSLDTYFNQKAWMQITDTSRRNSIRDRIAYLLADAYNKKKQYDKAESVRNRHEAEKLLFSKKIEQDQ